MLRVCLLCGAQKEAPLGTAADSFIKINREMSLFNMGP